MTADKMKAYKGYEIDVYEDFKGNIRGEADPLFETLGEDGRIFTAPYKTEIEALAILKQHIDTADKKRKAVAQ